jgi:hypothetical protein
MFAHWLIPWLHYGNIGIWNPNYKNCMQFQATISHSCNFREALFWRPTALSALWASTCYWDSFAFSSHFSQSVILRVEIYSIKPCDNYNFHEWRLWQHESCTLKPQALRSKHLQNKESYEIFDVSTPVTMKNAAVWLDSSKIVNNVGRTESHVQLFFVRFEVFTAVTLKNNVFWGVIPCGSC